MSMHSFFQLQSTSSSCLIGRIWREIQGHKVYRQGGLTQWAQSENDNNAMQGGRNLSSSYFALLCCCCFTFCHKDGCAKLPSCCISTLLCLFAWWHPFSASRNKHQGWMSTIITKRTVFQAAYLRPVSAVQCSCCSCLSVVVWCCWSFFIFDAAQQEAMGGPDDVKENAGQVWNETAQCSKYWNYIGASCKSSCTVQETGSATALPCTRHLMPTTDAGRRSLSFQPGTTMMYYCVKFDLELLRIYLIMATITVIFIHGFRDFSSLKISLTTPRGYW